MLGMGDKDNCCKDLIDFSCNMDILSKDYHIDKSNNTYNEHKCSFNNSLNNNDLIMLIVDASTRKIVNVNDSACRFYGYSREEILSKHIYDLHHITMDEAHDRSKHIIDNTKKRFTTQYNTLSGEIKHLEVYNNTFTIGDKEFINSVIFDITEKVEHEIELLESKEKYKKLVQLSPHAVMLHTDEQFIFVNKAGAKLLEVSHRKQLIGVSIKDFIHEEYIDAMLSKIEIIKNTNNPVLGRDMQIVTTTGKIVDVSMTSSRMQYAGEDAIMTILTDITERKEKERLLKKAEENKKKMDEMMEYDKLKTEFFANISHELRTPINVILGSLQLVDKYEEEFMSNPHKCKKLIRTMKQNCFRLLRLINNLIDITKIDSGYFKLNLQNDDIVKVIEDITLSTANYYTGNKGIEIIFDTDIEEKVMAFDPDKLERIMLNLLSNALKFTDEEDKIEVSVYDKEDNIVISVKDTGIGIPEEQLDIIFDRFRQVDKSLARNHEGSGIGLSLVKSFIDMHGGSINVKSEYGKGSEFIIKMPAKIVSDLNNIKNCRLTSIDDENMKKYVERMNVEFSDIYS